MVTWYGLPIFTLWWTGPLGLKKGVQTTLFLRTNNQKNRGQTSSRYINIPLIRWIFACLKKHSLWCQKFDQLAVSRVQPLRWTISKTRWFKVTFSSPSWRSLNQWKGSLNNPKKVTKNCQERVFFVVSKWPKWRFISLTCWSCCLEISSSNMPWVGIWNRSQEGIWAFFCCPLTYLQPVQTYIDSSYSRIGWQR